MDPGIGVVDVVPRDETKSSGLFLVRTSPSDSSRLRTRNKEHDWDLC